MRAAHSRARLEVKPPGGTVFTTAAHVCRKHCPPIPHRRPRQPAGER